MLAKSVLASTLAVVLVPFVHAQSNSSAPTCVRADDWSSIRAAYESGRHAIVANADGHRARTPGQAWSTEFDARAFTTTPDDGGWSWGLELTHVGAADVSTLFGHPIDVVADGQRFERRWSESLTEWYVNDTRGLEHGFTVHAPLSAAPSDLLTFDLTVRGDLTPRISGNGRDVTFLADTGHVVVNYAGLVVFDADGDHFAAHFESRGSALRLVVDARGAHYPLTIDPIAQQAYLKASNNDIDYPYLFGTSVAAYGDTVVVGAPQEDGGDTGVNGNQSNDDAPGSGAAYVFVRQGGGWFQQAYLKASNTDRFDQFGFAVSISGDTIAVSAPVEESDATGVNGDEDNNDAADSGAVYVFVRNGASWGQQAYIKSSNSGASDRFGWSVSISGNTLVAGAWGEDTGGGQSGAAYVFIRNGSTWSEQSMLKASNAEAGDEFGGAVAISGDTCVIGARSEDGGSSVVNGDGANNALTISGAAYVFQRVGNVWTQQAYLKASNTGTNDNFGCSVAISGDTAVIGACSEDSNAVGVNGDGSNNLSPTSGAAYVFTRVGSAWGQEAFLKASNTHSGAQFGSSVAISGDTTAIGALGEDSNATGIDGDQSNKDFNRAGAVFVFCRSGASWSQQRYLKASNTGSEDQFGAAVAVSSGLVIVGAPGEDSAATSVDGVQDDNSAWGAGAAYVFDLDFFELVPGCLVNPATFVEPSGAARIGTTVNFELLGGTLTDGFVATYYGAKSVDLAGCGLLLSPTEELLLALAPFPTLLGYGVMSGGLATVPVVVPNNLAFVGFEVTLQAAIVDTTTFASELSNAIEFEIRP